MVHTNKSDMLVTQLLNAQRLADEARNKLQKSEKENRAAIEDLQTEYTRLLEDVASETQDQGEGIVQKIENLSMPCTN